MATGAKAAAKKSTSRTKVAKESSSTAAPDSKAIGNAKLDALRAYIRAKGSQFLANPRIMSVGIGYKRDAGDTTPQLAVQFTVNQAVVPEDVGTADQIPKSIDIDGVQIPTEVIERTYKPQLRTTSRRPRGRKRVRSGFADVSPPARTDRGVRQQR